MFTMKLQSQLNKNENSLKCCAVLHLSVMMQNGDSKVSEISIYNNVSIILQSE